MQPSDKALFHATTTEPDEGFTFFAVDWPDATNKALAFCDESCRGLLDVLRQLDRFVE